MKKFSLPILAFFFISSFLLLPSPAYSQEQNPPPIPEKKKSSKDTNRIHTKKLSLPLPEEFDQVQKSLDDILKEFKKINLNKKEEPSKILDTLKMAVSPVEGTYNFFRKDAKRLPFFAKKLRNFNKLNSDEKVQVTLEGLKITVHSMDAIITGKVTVKIGVAFGKNLKKFWHLGATKAIAAAIAATSPLAAKELKQYIAWAQYSYKIKKVIYYLQKNYKPLKEKIERLMLEIQKAIKKKFPNIKPYEAPKPIPLPKIKKNRGDVQMENLPFRQAA